ncbi:hypothetical protein BKH43_07405 [Helicobacter sp. 13S00401-1]|uniref:helix-turn-helix domain-containing protein n=1 Tax=Helicobacter sp. 13S00401-1 TaxID=1905758 RepID=UPI000BA62241|nr:helix-turn-helix transcriptional regulator [Helicobacter sp. 13S00401-1]PAF49011.1 hypothetical protein BKH43_07405 [Helicobacter sp. 13S00401-1]
MAEVNYIKEVCARLGITQRQLAKELGYSEEVISRAANMDKISPLLKKNIESYINNDKEPVRDICKKLNLSQEELAKRIGVTKDTVSGWKRGIRDTPKWAINMFELLLIEKEYKALKETLKKL